MNWRLNALFLVVVTTMLGAFAAVDYVNRRDEREADMDRQVDAALSRLSQSLPTALWNLDQEQVMKTLQAELSAPFVVGITVSSKDVVSAGVTRDAQGTVVPLKAAPAADTSRHAALAYAEKGSQKPLGEATIYVSRAEIEAALKNDLRRMLLRVLGLDLVLLVALSIALHRIVLKPLRSVREAVVGMSEGQADLTRRLADAPVAEFDPIIGGFNRFTERLHDVVYQVRDSARSVAVGSAEIARGILDLSVRTEEQSANLQSITSAMRELTDGIQHNSRSAQEANQLTTASAQVVARGSGLMGGVVATMGRISASSKKISEIINVIDGIAFQTNILALNAAVEAARAGEQGRGFAVVASEVRLLAQRSATAAKEIKVLVSTSVDTIDAGCVQVNDAGRTMTEIVGAIQSVAAIVNEISSESSVQSASIDDIGRRVQAMDTVTQHNAALVEQGSASSATLRDDAAVLLAAVGTFQLREL